MCIIRHRRTGIIMLAPWEALTAAIEGCIGSDSLLASLFVNAELFLRIVLWLICVGVTLWISITSFPNRLLEGPFNWITLGVIWLWLSLNAASALVGRFTANVVFGADELEKRRDLRLPNLVINYQSFHLDRLDGILQGLTVTMINVIGLAAPAFIVYVAVERLDSRDVTALEGATVIAFFVLFVAMVVELVLNCLASALRLNDARDAASKSGSALTSSESVRVTLVQLKIFLGLTVVLPLATLLPLHALAPM